MNEEEEKNTGEPIFDYTIDDNNELNYIRNMKKMYHKQAKLRNELKLRKMNYRLFQTESYTKNTNKEKKQLITQRQNKALHHKQWKIQRPYS